MKTPGPEEHDEEREQGRLERIMRRAFPYVIVCGLALFAVTVSSDSQRKSDENAVDVARNAQKTLHQAARLAREVKRAQFGECLVGQRNYDAIRRILDTSPAAPLTIPPEFAVGVPRPTISLIENILNAANARGDQQLADALAGLGPRPDCTKFDPAFPTTTTTAPPFP